MHPLLSSWPATSISTSSSVIFSPAGNTGWFNEAYHKGGGGNLGHIPFPRYLFIALKQYTHTHACVFMSMCEIIFYIHPSLSGKEKRLHLREGFSNQASLLQNPAGEHRFCCSGKLGRTHRGSPNSTQTWSSSMFARNGLKIGIRWRSLSLLKKLTTLCPHLVDTIQGTDQLSRYSSWCSRATWCCTQNRKRFRILGSAGHLVSEELGFWVSTFGSATVRAFPPFLTATSF